MSLMSLSTQDWHERAAKLRYETWHFIDGEFVASADGARFTVVNPATNRPLCEVSAGGAADIDAAVAAAKRSFAARVWSRKAPRERMAVLAAFARLIEANAERFALLDTLCMGKPIRDMLASDIPAAALNFQYFGELLDKIDGAVTATAADAFHYILREPLGVVGCIVPWNYPLLMAAWKVAPALAAGNSVVLKPAEQSPLSGPLMAQLFVEAGGPPGVFNVVNGLGESAGAALALHREDRLHRLDRDRQTDVDLRRAVEHEAGQPRMRREVAANLPGRPSRSRCRGDLRHQRHLRQHG
jgi:gamma-glutamyl-gamma-aminobutyraldehyde dehydrogenase